ncbi:hypothetical protein ACWGKO_16335 [Streptomyces griseoincarnatus]
MINEAISIASFIFWGATAWVCAIIFTTLTLTAGTVWAGVVVIRALARRYRARTTPVDPGDYGTFA